MPPDSPILPRSFLNHISFNCLTNSLYDGSRSKEVESRSEGGRSWAVSIGFFSKKLKQNRYGGSPYSRSSSEVCAKFVAHRLERFQVKGYATPQPEYRDALVHAEIIFPRRPFVGTNCQLLRNPPPSPFFLFLFFFFSTDLWLSLFSRITHAPIVCHEFKCLATIDRNFTPRSRARIVDRYAFFPPPLLSIFLIRSFARNQGIRFRVNTVSNTISLLQNG